MKSEPSSDSSLTVNVRAGLGDKAYDLQSSAEVRNESFIRSVCVGRLEQLHTREDETQYLCIST